MIHDLDLERRFDPSRVPKQRKADELRAMMRRNKEQCIKRAITRIYVRLEEDAKEEQTSAVCSLLEEESRYVDDIVTVLRGEGFAVSTAELPGNRHSLSISWQ